MPPPGLEPGAYCLGGSRSIHLSYGGEATNVATRRETINGCLRVVRVTAAPLWRRRVALLLMEVGSG